MKEATRVVTLANGLRMIFDPVENRRTCAIGILVQSGVGYESPEQLGISHLIEHMVFRGTQAHSSAEIARMSDRIGGSLNAYTARDHTCFYAHALRENAPMALSLLCEMLTRPRFDPADLETEKGVVREEIAAYEDAPESLCADLFFANAWAGNTLGGNVLGTRETLAAMDRAALLRHMADFYTPERTILSFSGSFDEAEMTEICGAAFGSLPRGSRPPQAPCAVYTPFTLAVPRALTQNQLILGFEGEPGADLMRNHAACYLATMLTGMNSSRLYLRLRDALGLVYSVESDCCTYARSALFTVSMGMSEHTERQAIAEAVHALRELPRTFTAEELEVAREYSLAWFEMNGESLTSRAAYNAESLVDFGRLLPRAENRDALRSVSPELIRAVAEKMFDFDRISLCAVGQVQSAEDYRAYLASL